MEHKFAGYRDRLLTDLEIAVENNAFYVTTFEHMANALRELSLLAHDRSHIEVEETIQRLDRRHRAIKAVKEFSAGLKPRVACR